MENAEDTATWKANISIPRRQQFLPLLEEAVALGEEDNISIMICVVSALLVPFKRRRQAARVLFLANSGGCVEVAAGACVGVDRSRRWIRCVFKYAQWG